MKIKYLIKDILEYKNKNLLPNEKRFYDRYLVLPENFNLTYNKLYNVYSLYYDEKGCVNYLIINDIGVIYDFYPAEFFEIVDNRLSIFFVGNYRKFPIDYHLNFPLLISFKEAVEDVYFFDDFINGNNQAVIIFNKYVELMDMEFLNKELPWATYLDGNWYMCCNCDNVWKKDNFEINKCFKCNTLQNVVQNPPLPHEQCH